MTMSVITKLYGWREHTGWKWAANLHNREAIQDPPCLHATLATVSSSSPGVVQSRREPVNQFAPVPLFHASAIHKNQLRTLVN